MMLDIVGKRSLFFIISGVIILVSVVSLALFGLKPGVDFSGGSLTTLSFKQAVERGDLERELENLGYRARVQPTGEGYFSIRTGPLNQVTKSQLETSLQDKFGPVTEVGFDFIDPAIARETGRIAAIAVVVALIGILLYIWWAFRKMPSPLRFGASGIIALAHDVLVVTGIFSIFGKLLGWEIDLMFITGILAVVGYSINNTVVIFDRIRENVKLGISRDFEVTVNNSVVETLSRTLNTTITTLLAIWALMLFVGSSIQNFLMILMLGLIVGAYDAICVAPGLLVAWQRGRVKRA